MRRALANFIDLLPDFEVTGTAETAEEALDYFAEGHEVDLVLVDTRLPEASGIEFVSALQERHPDVKCLMLSGHEERSYIDQALDAGAKGYIVKGKSDEIPEAIKAVLNGGTYMSPALQTKAQRDRSDAGAEPT